MSEAANLLSCPFCGARVTLEDDSDHQYPILRPASEWEQPVEREKRYPLERSERGTIQVVMRDGRFQPYRAMCRTDEYGRVFSHFLFKDGWATHAVFVLPGGEG